MTPVERRWLEVGVRAPHTEEHEWLLSEALLELGGRAIEEREGWYVTHLRADDLEVADDATRARWHEELTATLIARTGLEEVELRTRWCEDQDWSVAWKRGLQVRRVTDRITVRPSWLPSPDPAPEVVIVLDPGMAFGTAEHGTTRGCLRLLDRAVASGDRVVDVGSGSGILAIAAAKLGASAVTAIEGDALACEALEENLASNRVAERVHTVKGLVDAEGLAEHGPADGVVANIESLTLQRLMPGFAATVRPGGWLILSGIQASQWAEVRNVAEGAGFAFDQLDRDGEWRSALFTKGEAQERPRRR